MSFQVLPIPSIPSAVFKYTSQTPPAGLLTLGKHTSIAAGPEALMGSGLPPSKIFPASGIYGTDGRLPVVPPPGMTFMARA